MLRFRLSVGAESTLRDIYVETEAKYGRYQAEAYYAGMTRTFGLLADFPAMGVSADELVAGCRRFRFQAHYIYYTQEADHVFIRAIPHVRQNLRPGLIE